MRSFLPSQAAYSNKELTINKLTLIVSIHSLLGESLLLLRAALSSCFSASPAEMVVREPTLR